MLRIAINGFGRIGRMVLRSILELQRESLQVVAINDCGNIETLLHLFEYDSVHGRLQTNIINEKDRFKIGSGKWIKVFSESRCDILPWKELDLDIVIDCSGQKKSKNLLSEHISAGAKKVIISTIIDDADYTVIYGINHSKIEKKHKILSNASCTSNCLITTIYPLHTSIGIESGHMMSIHAYTSDQSLVDSSHTDLRRARAVSASIIPSSTNASKAVGLLLPDLNNKIHCTAARVPILNVSMIDFNFLSKTKTTEKEINEEIIKASKTYLKGVIACNDKLLVSIDFNHDANSAIIDLTQTKVTEGHLCRVSAWYDNEWAYANRLCDVANYIYLNKLL